MRKLAAMMLLAALLVPLSGQTAETLALTPAPQAEETDTYAEPPGESPYAAAFFNVSYYAQTNPDLAAASGGDGGLLRAHWLSYGIHEGRRGSPCFDAGWYLAGNPDLAAEFGIDYARAALHYHTLGVAQGKAGSAVFDPDDYAQLNADLAAQYGNDLRALAQHYNDQGFEEGRMAYSEAAHTQTPQPEATPTPPPEATPGPAATADAAEPGMSKPWPVIQVTLYQLKAVDRGDQRAIAYRGPGRHYLEANGFRTVKMSSVQGIFMEGNYILTEMNYAGVGKRRLYFTLGTFVNSGDTPAWDMQGFNTHTAADTYPRYGPGEDYNDFGGEVLPSGSPVSVFFEENGWLFMEYSSPNWLGRGWIPAESAVPVNQYDGSSATSITPLTAMSTPGPAGSRHTVTERIEPVTPSPITPEPVSPEAVEPEPAAPESFSLLPSFTTLITIAPPHDVQPLSVSADISFSLVSGTEDVAIFVDAEATGGTGEYRYGTTFYKDDHFIGAAESNHAFIPVSLSERDHTYKAVVTVSDGLSHASAYTPSIRPE